ncbi:hypothetical protein BT96DRAFT_970740 [Gymnopus androsaceus JB14]|uniref:Uncharacterized protein n=1 Tax=Gymnopus androsaceus JB14 TaxID=1447944 RepID=A0A6A4IEM3_9AGAR|nr:hypothetical protein BT96DRAFT_970740 [Gymnopus androsaceus JB14]
MDEQPGLRQIVLSDDLTCNDALDRLANKYGKDRVPNAEMLLYKPKNLSWMPRDTLMERTKSWLLTTRPTNLDEHLLLKSYFPQGLESQNGRKHWIRWNADDYQFPLAVIRREELVKSLYTHARAQRFFLVHGSPGSGKTTLCRLLHNYILDQEKDAEVQVLDRSVMDAFAHALESYKVFGYAEAMSGDGNKRWMLFDDGQETYDDARLWNTLFKLDTLKENTYIVFFAAYGSAKVGGRGLGTPVVINDEQRMAMWPTNDGRSALGSPLPIASLYLLRSEYDEMVQLRQRDLRLPRIMDDLKEWLFNFTAGHVGAVESILQGIMHQKACIIMIY